MGIRVSALRRELDAHEEAAAADLNISSHGLTSI